MSVCTKAESSNTLELDAGVHWEAKNELNRLAASLKPDMT